MTAWTNQKKFSTGRDQYLITYMNHLKVDWTKNWDSTVTNNLQAGREGRGGWDGIDLSHLNSHYSTAPAKLRRFSLRKQGAVSCGFLPRLPWTSHVNLTIPLGVHFNARQGRSWLCSPPLLQSVSKSSHKYTAHSCRSQAESHTLPSVTFTEWPHGWELNRPKNGDLQSYQALGPYLW